MNNKYNIFLDNAATMPPNKEIVEDYFKNLELNSCNYEAIHALAYSVRKNIEQASIELANSLNLNNWSVIFANSGTEVISSIIQSSFFVDKKVCSSQLEHPAIKSSLSRVCKNLRYLEHSDNGKLYPNFYIDDEILFIHHIQNETGRIQDVEAIIQQAKEKNPNILVIIDAIQSANKIPLSKSADINIISGKKFGAIGGAAMLINPNSCNFKTLKKYFAEQRQKNYIYGRVDAGVILSLAKAAKSDNYYEKIKEINLFLRENLKDSVSFTINEKDASPYILHFSNDKLQSAVVIRMLSELGIYMGVGSACASETKNISEILKAMNFSKSRAYGTFRLSLGFQNTIEDAKKFLEAWRMVLKNY